MVMMRGPDFVIEKVNPTFQAIFGERSSQRRHHLTIDVPETLVVDADPMRLAQVFANLITNAAKYTENEGHIAIRAVREGNDAVVSVKDDGIGITAEMLPRVFDLFVQEQQRSTALVAASVSVSRSCARWWHSTAVE